MHVAVQCLMHSTLVAGILCQQKRWFKYPGLYACGYQHISMCCGGALCLDACVLYSGLPDVYRLFGGFDWITNALKAYYQVGIVCEMHTHHFTYACISCIQFVPLITWGAATMVMDALCASAMHPCTLYGTQWSLPCSNCQCAQKDLANKNNHILK